MPRTQKLFIVSNGTIKDIDVDTGTLNATTGGTSVLITTTDYVDSTPGADSNMYWVDGTNAVRYLSSTDAVSDWAAAVTGGTFPADGSNLPRLIALWRGRIVLSGITTDPHNWFMSRSSDHLDFDYGAAGTDYLRAAAGNNTDTGKVGDLITALIPYDKDRLIFGGDHTIFMMTGDPARGGEIELVSNGTGIAFGKAWAIDPNQTVYFFGTNGVYRFVPGNQPESISRNRMDAVFRAVNLSTHRVRLEYDTAYFRLYVFITRVSDGASTHYVWEERADAWWRDAYPDDHGPVSTYVLDADAPNDRALLLGGRDGYVRKFDPTSLTDDGTAISSYVHLQPIRMGEHGQDQVLRRLTMTLSGETTNLDYEVRASPEAENLATDDATAKTAGSYTTGDRQIDDRRSVRGNNLGIKLANATSGKTWAIEDMSAEVEVRGKTKKP